MKRISLLPLLFMTTMCALVAQVPFDLSKAVTVKTVMNVRIGPSVMEPWYVPSPCGAQEKDLLIVAWKKGAKVFNTKTRIDTANTVDSVWSIFHSLIDYDGVQPLEYMDNIGRIARCETITDIKDRTLIDTVNCWTQNILPEYSVDVDGDGYLDIVCDLLGGGVLAHVILGGPNAGKGCERVAVIRGYRHNDSSYAQKFFRSSSGRWRLLQWERGRSDLSPQLVLYDVGLKRVGNMFETTFTPLDSLYGGSSSLSVDPLGMAEELVDTVHHKDYMLIDHVVNFNNRTWAVERFDITDGKFGRTGEVVTGYNLGFVHSLGHSLGTDIPVIGISSDRGTCYCYADNITTPFARFIPTKTGIQPVAGLVVINDQTGDGMPDFVLTGGSPTDGRMAVVTFDQSVGVDEVTTDEPASSTTRIVGDHVEILLTTPETISIDVATVTGEQWTAVPATPVNPGTTRYDIATLLHNRPAGAYFLRVHMGARIVAVPVTR